MSSMRLQWSCLLRLRNAQKLHGLHSQRSLVLRLIAILPELVQQLTQHATVLMMQGYILFKQRLHEQTLHFHIMTATDSMHIHSRCAHHMVKY